VTPMIKLMFKSWLRLGIPGSMVSGSCCRMCRCLRVRVQDGEAVIHADCAVMKLVFDSGAAVAAVHKVFWQQVLHSNEGLRSFSVVNKGFVGEAHVVYDVAGLVARPQPRIRPEVVDPIEAVMAAGLRNVLPEPKRHCSNMMAQMWDVRSLCCVSLKSRCPLVFAWGVYHHRD
jgi:hypothetical protein